MRNMFGQMEEKVAKHKAKYGFPDTSRVDHNGDVWRFNEKAGVGNLPVTKRASSMLSFGGGAELGAAGGAKVARVSPASPPSARTESMRNMFGQMEELPSRAGDVSGKPYFAGNTVFRTHGAKYGFPDTSRVDHNGDVWRFNEKAGVGNLPVTKRATTSSMVELPFGGGAELIEFSGAHGLDNSVSMVELGTPRRPWSLRVTPSVGATLRLDGGAVRSLPGGYKQTSVYLFRARK